MVKMKFNGIFSVLLFSSRFTLPVARPVSRPVVKLTVVLLIEASCIYLKQIAAWKMRSSLYLD